jgi:hypothetical protein
MMRLFPTTAPARALLATLACLLAWGCGDDSSAPMDAGRDANTSSDSATPVDSSMPVDSSAPADSSMPTDASSDAAEDASVPGRSWIFMPLGDGSKPVLALTSSGDVQVATIYEANPGWVRHVSFAADATSAPSPTDVAAEYFYGPIDVGSLADGTPVVAYHDHTLEDQVLAVGDGAGGFTLSPMSNPGHDGWYNALTVDSSDVVHTATYDPSGFSGLGVYYGTWDGSWTVELAVSGSFDYAGGMSIARASDGSVYIAYFDDGASRGMLARRMTDGTWSTQMIDPDFTDTVETGRFPFLRLDSTNALHVVYLSRDTMTSGSVRYGTGTWDAMSYEAVGRLDDIEIGFDGARNIATLALDPASDAPVIVAQSKTLTWLATRGAGGFVVEPVASGTTFAQQTSVAVRAGVIHLVYWQRDGAVPGTVIYGRAAL